MANIGISPNDFLGTLQEIGNIFDNSTSGGTGLSAAISRIEGKEISNIQIGVSTFSGVTFITKGT